MKNEKRKGELKIKFQGIDPPARGWTESVQRQLDGNSVNMMQDLGRFYHVSNGLKKLATWKDHHKTSIKGSKLFIIKHTTQLICKSF